MIHNFYYPNKHKIVSNLKKEFKRNLPLWWKIAKIVAVKLGVRDVVKSQEDKFVIEHLKRDVGAPSWEQIPAASDNRINRHELIALNYYQGYYTVTKIEKFSHHSYSEDLRDEIISWCIANLKSDWRLDGIWTDSNGVMVEKDMMDEFGLYIAFSSRDDFVWFDLTWK